MKEKFTYINTTSTVNMEENKIISFDKNNTAIYSFRVGKDGFLGIHYQEGEMSDEEGYARAEQNLELKRPYPFELETGERHRDKTEKVLADREVFDLAKEILEHLSTKYPDFRLNGNVLQRRMEARQENDRGLNYSNKDCSVHAGISFKHKDSKDINDGWFGIDLRNFEKEKLYSMADNYLSNFGSKAELPGEIIIQMQYYSLLGKLQESLDAEKLSLGTSLLSGKLGEKVFSDQFTLCHDVSDAECWYDNFFDGEGVVLPGDRLTYIENGVVLRGYADKRIAKKYGVEHTGSAFRDYSDIPLNGNVIFRITRSKKTIKELLSGRLSIVPVRFSGGGFNEKGEYVMPVQMAYLCDGERFLGRLPEFTLVNNMFDMFGKDFIGVGSDNPVFNDKQILVKMRLGSV
ncbi:MAG: hypothetical protein K2N63_01170 [Lachnospiraceae bacterium]|nr:hypothetical protein [Lachnospiraceae bacterium]